MLKASPVEDGAVLVDAIAMTVSTSLFVISLLNISSVSEYSCGYFGICDIPCQMLSSAFLDILCEICDNIVLKYASSVRNRSCSIPLSD